MGRRARRDCGERYGFLRGLRCRYKKLHPLCCGGWGGAGEMDFGM